jgi:hypothetical protein
MSEHRVPTDTVLRFKHAYIKWLEHDFVLVNFKICTSAVLSGCK